MALKKQLFPVANAMWGWNPGTDQVCVVPWPDVADLTGAYECTAGACFVFVRKLSPAQRQHYVVAEAIKLMVRDGCDARAVHTAFSDIQEYRDFLSEYETFDHTLLALYPQLTSEWGSPR